jgi:hypothetical protein
MPRACSAWPEGVRERGLRQAVSISRWKSTTSPSPTVSRIAAQVRGSPSMSAISLRGLLSALEEIAPLLALARGPHADVLPAGNVHVAEFGLGAERSPARRASLGLEAAIDGRVDVTLTRADGIVVTVQGTKVPASDLKALAQTELELHSG